MLSMDYHESMGKIEEHEGNKYLMVNDYINSKNIVILIKRVLKDDAKFYPQIFLERALYNEEAQRKALKER